MTALTRRIRILSGLVGSLLAATAMVGSAFGAQPETLLVARSQDSDSLDAHRVSTTISLQMMHQLFDNLLYMDERGDVKPGLAESWTVSGDGKTYTFTVRKGLKCHDGTTFDAAAAKWNWDRATDPDFASPNAPFYGDVKATRVEGDNFILELNAAFSPLRRNLASPVMKFMCPTSVQGEDFAPVGTGPFKYVNWDRNNELVLERYDAYQNFHPMIDNPGAVPFKRLIVKVITEGPARMAALRNGEVHFILPSLEEAPLMKDDPAFKLYNAPLSGQQGYISFAFGRAPFDAVEGRRAIAHALNRELIVDISMEGTAILGQCPVAPGLFSSDQEWCKQFNPIYDPEQAKAELANLGYGPDNPLKVLMNVPTLPGWDETHVVMQQQLADVGVEAKIETRQFATWLDVQTQINTSTEGVASIYTMGMSNTDPDLLNFLWYPPGYGSGAPNDPVLHKMLEDQRQMSDDKEREAKFREIHKHLLENVYLIPLWSPGWFWLYGSLSTVENFKQDYLTSPMFNDVVIGD